MMECNKGRGRIAPCILQARTKRAVSDLFHSLLLTAGNNLYVAAGPESLIGYIAHECYCPLTVYQHTA